MSTSFILAEVITRSIVIPNTVLAALAVGLCIATIVGVAVVIYFVQRKK